jgi:hypothetical protein
VSRTYFRAGSVCPENLAQMPLVCHFLVLSLTDVLP